MYAWEPLPFLGPALALLGLAAVGAAALAYRIVQGPFEPVLWQSPPPLAELAGPVLAPNWDLAGAEHLFLNRLVGPESIAIGGGGELYLSLNDGRVVRTDADFSSMTTVFFTGGVVKAEAEGAQAQHGDEAASTDGPQGRHWVTLPALPNGAGETELSGWCTAEMQAYRFSTPTETKCGRPLGMRFVPLEAGGGHGHRHGHGHGHGLLYIADAYHGLFTLHTGDLTVKHLVRPEAPAAIEGKEGMHPGISQPLRFSNDLDTMADGLGDVFFTDSTWAWSRAEHAVEIMDGAPRGRLLRYDGATGRVEPVLCGLHFANGVQLLDGGRALLVVESTRFRILRVDLDAWRRAGPDARLAALRACDEDAPRPPFVSTFVEGLPGLPDNLRLHEGAAKGPLQEGGVLLLGMGAKNAQPFALLQFLYQHRLLRLVLGALVPLKHFHTLVPKYGLAGVLSQVRACVCMRA